MKKISKIFALILCLTLVLAVLPMGASAAENCVEFTVDSLGLESQAYSASTATVDGVAVEWVQLGNYGDGIQMRDSEKNGEWRTSMFWNTGALGNGITKIVLTFNSGKTTYDNPDAVIFNFGNSAKGDSYTTKLSTEAGNKTYTITPNATTYTYFYMEHDLGYTFYWDSIKVYYTGTAAGGNSGNGGNSGSQTPVTPPPASGSTTVANGEYVIYAPAHNMALSSEKTGYYNAGVEVTVTDGVPSGYGDTEKWTITNNADGSIYISQNGQKLSLADSFSSMNMNEVNDKWILEDAGNGLYYVKNAVRGNYIEWYASKNNWSSYGTINEGSEGLFALKLYGLNVQQPSQPSQPSQPDVPEVKYDPISDAVAGADGEEFTVKGTVVLIDGKNVYVQDATGGICVRASANVEDLAVGDVVVGTGTKSVYNGLPQLGGTYEKVSGGKVVAKEATIAGLTTADLCTYIKLSNVTVTEVYDNDGQYSSPNVKVSDGENEIQLYKAVVGKNDDGTWAVAVGDKIDVYCAVSCFKDTLQLRNSYVTEVVPAGSDAPEFINPDTGDMTIAGLVVAMMAAAGCAVVLTKKKEF